MGGIISDTEMLDVNPIQPVEPVHVEPEPVHVEPEPEKQRSRKKQRDGEREREKEGEVGRDVNRGRGEKRKREDEDEEEISHTNVNSAFQNIMKERTWHVKGFKDHIGALNRHKKRIKHELLYTLIKVSPQKWYIALKCRFYQMDKGRNRTEYSSFFHGTMHTLLRRDEFEDTY